MLLSEEDEFAEKFALYLTVGLLGPTRVIEYLNNDKGEKSAIPMYWRSKLLIPDASRLLLRCREGDDSKLMKQTVNKALFFDLTFEFDKKLPSGRASDDKSDLHSAKRPSSRRVLVSLGFFLLLEKGSEIDVANFTDSEIIGGRYIATQPMDFKQIISYMDSLQLDRDSVNPSTLASCLAEELLRQGSFPSTELKNRRQTRGATDVLTVDYHESVNEESGEAKSQACPDQSANSNGLSSICVTIPCKSMGNLSGKILLKHSPSSISKFDSYALRFLSWDLSKNPNNIVNVAWSKGEPLISKIDLVYEAFHRWQMQLETSSRIDNDVKKTGKESSNNRNKSTTSVDISSNCSTKNNERNKKRRSFKGSGILPSARRKRNKGLVYDAK